MKRSATTPARWPCIEPAADGCVLRVLVVPQAGRDGIVGLHDGQLRLRLAAPAVDGRANAALVAWLADQLDLPRRDVELVQGLGARRKRLRLACAAEHVAAWLERALGATGPG